MTVVSFIDYTPESRYDGVSWNQVIIAEAPAASGPWTNLETKNVGVDVDPANPLPRSFTTSLATLAHGWYRITWLDPIGNQQPTNPVFNAASLEWRPSLSDVAALDLARTKDDVGKILETFTDKTTPTDEQTNKLIDKAVADLMPFLGTDIPDSQIANARNLVALKTVMYIELTHYGTEVAQQRSPYQHYKDLLEEQLPWVVDAIEAIEAGADEADNVELGDLPAYSFPAPSNWLDRKM